MEHLLFRSSRKTFSILNRYPSPTHLAEVLSLQTFIFGRKSCRTKMASWLAKCEAARTQLELSSTEAFTVRDMLNPRTIIRPTSAELVKRLNDQRRSAHQEPPVHLREEATCLWPVRCSNVCGLQAESCLGTCGRSTSRACPPSCTPASAARL